MPEKLKKQTILSSLHTTLDDLIVVDTIGSTNDALYSLLKTHSHLKIAFLSEEQTTGKGRLGKIWHSPKYQNIYCSLSWCTKKSVTEIQGLSMHIGSALLGMLKDYGLDENKLFLKHPNDILFDKKKLLGILIETFSTTHNETVVIIGIGCNVHAADDKENKICQPWISLDQITQSTNDRNQLAGRIINAVYNHLSTI